MNLQRISKLCAVNFYYSCLYKYEYVDLCRGEESIRKWGGGGGGGEAAGCFKEKGHLKRLRQVDRSPCV